MTYGTSDTPGQSGRRSNLWAFWAGFVLVILVGGTMIFHCLGCASLLGDEAIYALASREAADSGDWLPLRISGNLYLGKPPLKITIVTALFAAFGESEFVARFPDAVFGLVTISLVYIFAARRFSVPVALVSSMLLLGTTSYLVVHGARDSVQDSLITLLATIACFAWIEYRRLGGERKWWAVAAVVLVAAGFTKDVMGVVFAVTIVAIEIAFWLWDRRRPESLARSLWLPIISAAGAALYAAAMIWITNGYYLEFLYENVAVRATTGVDPVHVEGPLFYPRRLALDFGWWLVALLPAGMAIIRLGRDERGRVALFLGLWAAALVAGFSLSVSKLPWYVYPAYPALSLLIGIGLWWLLSWVRRGPVRMAVSLVVAVLLCLRLAGAWQAVKRDVEELDAARFARVYSSLEDARLVVDVPSILKNGRLRSWNVFYLRGVENVTWSTAERKVPISASSESCIFLATGDPASHVPTAHLPWRPIMKIGRVDRLAGDIWMLGTCDLEVPGVSPVSAGIFDHVIVAEGFEGGGFGPLIPIEENRPLVLGGGG